MKLQQKPAEQYSRSPRVSKEWTAGELQQSQQYGGELAQEVTASLTSASLQQQDALAVAQNGGLTGSTTEDAEMADAEGDDGMEDDMMDKISSSPSIDDGGYSLPHLWPQRSDSLTCDKSPTSSPSCPQACCESSSPFMETPDHYPLRPLRDHIFKEVVSEVQSNILHHLPPGEYLDETSNDGIQYEDRSGDAMSPMPLDDMSNNEHNYEDSHCHPILLIPADDIKQHSDQYDLDYDIDAFPRIPENCFSSPPALEQTATPANVDGNMTIPYELSEDEDDDYDIPYTADSRFVDSGWGGECLQELEDIDFEFVYALHTFVATVEGQANATKGDTMVLLDDSNSYWWLVRVVKDSSIGESTNAAFNTSSCTNQLL